MVKLLCYFAALLLISSSTTLVLHYGMSHSPNLYDKTKPLDTAGQHTDHGYLIDGDYTWSRYCRATSPCIALLSASHHNGISSTINQKTLMTNTQVKSTKETAAKETSLKHRILLREGYCAIYGCDVIIDYNNYNANQTMWLSDYGKHKVGPMPPHWNKVAAIQRWLPHFDAVVWMDMDIVWVDFNTSVYDMFNITTSIYTNGNPELVMFRRGELSQCIVNNWWYYGTSPGCRYFKYPHNYRSQTQNLDMPWFWYAMLKCGEIYREEPYECLNTCNGPAKYVDVLQNDPNYESLEKLWIAGCFRENRRDAKKYSKAIDSLWFNTKHLVFEMNWGSKYGMSFLETLGCSNSVHCKDSRDMVDWLNKTAEVLLSAGCSLSSCDEADTSMLYNNLHNWSSNLEEGDLGCIEKFYGVHV